MFIFTTLNFFQGHYLLLSCLLYCTYFFYLCFFWKKSQKSLSLKKRDIAHACLIGTYFERLHNVGNEEWVDEFELENTFFNQSFATNKDPDQAWWYPILRGMAEQPGQAADRFLSDAVTNRLFHSKEQEAVEDGHKDKMELSDLSARNIQRGRDHGLPCYHEYREQGWNKVKPFLVA